MVLGDWLLIGTPEVARMPLNQIVTRTGRPVRRFYNLSPDPTVHYNHTAVVTAQCPIPDDASKNVGFCFRDLTRFLEESRKRNEPVMVYSSSSTNHAATSLAAYLMALDDYTPRQAAEFLKVRVPHGFIPTSEQWEVLRLYETLLKSMSAPVPVPADKLAARAAASASMVGGANVQTFRRNASHPSFPTSPPTSPELFRAQPAAQTTPSSIFDDEPTPPVKAAASAAPSAWPSQSDDIYGSKPAAVSGGANNSVQISWSAWAVWAGKKLVGLN